jgi:hypothetical protein
METVATILPAYPYPTAIRIAGGRSANKAAGGKAQWPAQNLPTRKISSPAGIQLLVKAALGHVEGQPEPGYPSPAELTKMFGKNCSTQQQQFLIRRFGLDGRQSQNFERIARDAYTTETTVRWQIDRALRRLAVPLNFVG